MLYDNVMRNHYVMWILLNQPVAPAGPASYKRFYYRCTRCAMLRVRSIISKQFCKIFSQELL